MAFEDPFASPPELREDNPYSVGSVFVFDEGDYVLDGGNINLTPSPRDRYYTVKEGDDIWNLTFQAYGNSRWYWLILQVNDIEFAFELPVGKTLRIPDLTTAQLDL